MYYDTKVNEKKKNKKYLLAALFVMSIMLTMASYAANQPAVSNGEKIPLFNCEEDFGIRKALAMLGEMCGKNIVPSPSVDGQLAFRSLKDVTFDEAMDAILGEGFVYSKDGNLIKVYTKEEYQKIMEDPNRRVYKVFTLYYISAAEAMKLVSPALSQNAVIQGSTPVEKVATTGESITSGTGGGDTLALNDTLIVRDYPENVVEAEKLIKQLDVRPKQVLVEATILSATLQEGMNLGIDLNFFGGVGITGTSSVGQIGTTEQISTTTTTPIAQVAAGGAGSPIETTGFANVGGGGLVIGATSADFTAIITALEQVTDTTLLANPKILAVNKQLGQVYIGTKIGYVSQTTQNQTSTTQQVQFLDTGTKLSFTPFISDDGYIRMTIHPKDSSGTLKSNSIPDESSTELATDIIVKDGQTIVIGGLFRDVTVTSRSQIPLLGDLPLIGVAFRKTSDSVTRQEVIVLLTPHIISEPEQTNSAGREDDISRKVTGAKDELQWFSRSRMAEDHYEIAAKLYAKGDSAGALNHLNAAIGIRPSYLEALRLKERIISETNPDKIDSMGRKAVDKIDEKESPNWTRR
jgi:type IV pilus assembly protein PilQ